MVDTLATYLLHVRSSLDVPEDAVLRRRVIIVKEGRRSSVSIRPSRLGKIKRYVRWYLCRAHTQGGIAGLWSKVKMFVPSSNIPQKATFVTREDTTYAPVSVSW